MALIRKVSEGEKTLGLVGKSVKKTRSRFIQQIFVKRLLWVGHHSEWEWGLNPRGRGESRCDWEARCPRRRPLRLGSTNGAPWSCANPLPWPWTWGSRAECGHICILVGVWCLESWEPSQRSSETSDIWFLSEKRFIHQYRAARPPLGIRQMLHMAAPFGAPVRGEHGYGRPLRGGRCRWPPCTRCRRHGAKVTVLTATSLSPPSDQSSRCFEAQISWNILRIWQKAFESFPNCSTGNDNLAVVPSYQSAKETSRRQRSRFILCAENRTIFFFFQRNPQPLTNKNLEAYLTLKNNN